MTFYCVYAASKRVLDYQKEEVFRPGAGGDSVVNVIRSAAGMTTTTGVGQAGNISRLSSHDGCCRDRRGVKQQKSVL